MAIRKPFCFEIYETNFYVIYEVKSILIMKTELTKEEIKLLYKKLTWLNDNSEGATLKGIIGECLEVFKEKEEESTSKFDDKPCKQFNGKVNGPGWSCRIYATRCNGIDCKERCTYWKSKGKKF